MIAIVFPKRTPFSRVVLVSRKKITYEVNHILKCVSEVTNFSLPSSVVSKVFVLPK